MSIEEPHKNAKTSCKRDKKELYSLLHEVVTRMGRGPRQGLAARPGQNKALKVLDRNGGEMRQQELLAELGIRAGSLSELLRKLEDDNYVTRRRSEENRSEIIVTITERGRISVLENKLSEKEREEELFGCLNKEERDALARTLKKLLAAWDEADPETEGQRRERRWKENTAMLDEAREIDAALERVLAE